MLRVGARNRAGPLGAGGSIFSSGTTLASPNVRDSFVLRDRRHIKSCRAPIGNRVDHRPETSGKMAASAILKSVENRPHLSGATGRNRVYSLPHSAYAGCASARPPGADTRRPSPPPPLARVVLYLVPGRRRARLSTGPTALHRVHKLTGGSTIRAPPFVGCPPPRSCA